MPIRAINESFMVLLIGSLINLEYISLWTFSETVNSLIVFHLAKPSHLKQRDEEEKDVYFRQMGGSKDQVFYDDSLQIHRLDDET